MANIGKLNALSVVAINEKGAYLDAGEHGEILLPHAELTTELTTELAENDTVEVFIYRDSADRLAATLKQPFAQVDQFVSLKVVAVNKLGAFLDWGLPKDLLVPGNEQYKRMEMGKYYLVRIYLDLRTERIAASSKLDKFIDVWPADYQEGEQVELTIAAKTDLGFKAIINDLHWGLLYDNEIFQPLRIGKKVTGYIKQVRADGLIDLALSQTGRAKVRNFNDKLLAYLQENDGFSPLHDKSSPELIKNTLGVSKKTFKAGVGHLLKKGLITIETNGIKLK